jgi:DDE superfamily endonuclease
LAQQAPGLAEAVERAGNEGVSHVILDGKVIPCDRCKEPVISVKGEAVDLWYAGKARTHGGNIAAVLAPGGFRLWMSPVVPGSVHDLIAARLPAVPALYPAAAAGLPTLAGPGYDGAGIGIYLPAQQPADGREPDINTRTRNAIQRSLRCLGERGFARLSAGLATTIPAVLDDLAHIDTACVSTGPVLPQIPAWSSTTPRPSPARPASPAGSPGPACSPPKTAPRPSGCWPAGSTRP